MKAQILATTTAFALMSFCAGTLAEPAIYRDGAMHLDTGVLITEARQEYFGDIVMELDATGKLMITSAAPRPLVQIDSVEPVVVENEAGREVTLAIAGNKSVPCVELEEVAVSRKDDTFTVLVAETVLGPEESCVAVLDPFEISVPLDLTGLDAGTYQVTVNGVESEFVLTQDEPAPANP